MKMSGLCDFDEEPVLLIQQLCSLGSVQIGTLLLSVMNTNSGCYDSVTA